MSEEQAAHELRRRADELECLLPQLQCTKCGYAGCRPYSEALAADTAAPDLCQPGGNRTAQALAKKIGWKNNQLRDLSDKCFGQCACIDESRCVGCYKCIEACPVDAIVGAHGMLHTVIAQQCTGCGLCVEPCPVDCIAMIEPPPQPGDGQRVRGGVIGDVGAQAAAARLRRRHEAKRQRPPLRVIEQLGELTPKQLARRAMNRAWQDAQRGKNKASKPVAKP